MNTMLMTVILMAGSFFMLLPTPVMERDIPDPITIDATDDVAWNEKAVQWLIEAQSPNGGWGAGSHAMQNIKDPHVVQTDPATTAFAAMALLKAGGSLEKNVYKKQIMLALDRILKDIKDRPDNGRITSLNGTQPQVKLGIHIDASMALQFLTTLREEVKDPAYESKIDLAAETCISLIQKSQNADGGWAGGGWAPVLQSAMANSALELARDRYQVDETVIESSRKYQADNITSGGVRAEDAAGIQLYAVASTQRATMLEAREAETMLKAASPAGISTLDTEDEIVKTLSSTGVKKDKAEQLARAYVANQSATKVLQDEDVWQGFGNNGGEEYLSYMMTSEALYEQDKNEWLKWKQNVESKFRESQNPNGSWSGHHCITSPVFCTAAIIQAWNGKA